MSSLEPRTCLMGEEGETWSPGVGRPGSHPLSPRLTWERKGRRDWSKTSRWKSTGLLREAAEKKI